MEQEEKEVQKEEQKEREYELQEGTPTEKTVEANTGATERKESETEKALKILLGEKSK